MPGTADQKDWVSNTRSYAIAWGLPTAILIGAAFLTHPAKTLIWTVTLIWMGVACLANARRCGRRHCYLTGPFFLFMAALTLFHGFELVSLGSQGWLWLGSSLIAGLILLWYVPEKLWGKYKQ